MSFKPAASRILLNVYDEEYAVGDFPKATFQSFGTSIANAGILMARIVNTANSFTFIITFSSFHYIKNLIRYCRL